MTRQAKLKGLQKALEFILDDSADIYILFVDLCGSSAYKRRDQPEWIWITRQLLFLQRVASFVKRRNGIVVKTIGDEIMAIFEVSTLPDDILKCAFEIIQGFENLNLFQGKEIIEVKVSIDFGSTYNGSINEIDVYDPIGTPVDRCARLNSITRNNEITFSKDFHSTLLANSSEAQLQAKYGYTTRLEDLKGIDKTTVYSIVTETKENIGKIKRIAINNNNSKSITKVKRWVVNKKVVK